MSSKELRESTSCRVDSWDKALAAHGERQECCLPGRAGRSRPRPSLRTNTKNGTGGSIISHPKYQYSEVYITVVKLISHSTVDQQQRESISCAARRGDSAGVLDVVVMDYMTDNILFGFVQIILGCVTVRLTVIYQVLLHVFVLGTAR